MKQEYVINELKPGMYIAEVLEQSGKLKIKTQGVVSTLTAIKTLNEKGVRRVLVDLSKSKLEQQDNSEQEETIESATPQSTAQAAKPVSFDNEVKKAATLYDEAKSIQQRAFNNAKAGKAIDTGAMKDIASDFIDSAFRNQDALACMTRMRMKDEYLIEHSINVSIIMTLFAKHLNFERDVIEQLATGALLLDLGKIGIADSILNSPKKLNEQETTTIQNHVNLGHKVLSKSGDLGEISLEIVLDHHENVDGSGYPNGKKAEQLSQYAKMAAIVDSYDAITADKIYQPAKSPVNAFKILRNECGTRYDSELVAEFIKCMGIHPVGTLVKMKSNKLGIVIQSNHLKPTLPKVNIFYSVGNKCYIESKVVDLAAKNCHDEIERSVKPEDFKLDILKFFKEVLLA